MADLLTVTKGNVTVADGLFTVELDFGSVFDGTAVWLDISVRPGSSSGAYTALSPCQALTAAPYALSLQPGATIQGSVGYSALTVVNTAASGSGLAILGQTDSPRTATASPASPTLPAELLLGHTATLSGVVFVSSICRAIW